MEYEKYDNSTPINFQFIGVILVCLAVIGFMMYPIIKSSMTQKEIVNTSSNITTITKIEYVTVLVTPMPDGINYYASEYQEGIRKVGRWFSWIHENVSGYQDMKGHLIVYDYKEFNKLNYFDSTDNKYHLMVPSSGKKYVIVFIEMYLDDIVYQDVRMHIPDRKYFLLQSHNATINNLEYPYYLRIKELEYTYNNNDDMRVKAFRQNVRFSRNTAYKESGGYYSEDVIWLYGGKSNSEDGYLIYEVDKKENINDLTLCSAIEAHSNICWRLMK